MKRKDVRNSHFPIVIFLVTFLIILLVGGIHTGIITFFDENVWGRSLSGIAKTTIVICYWLLIAGGFTFFTAWQIRKAYEIPMKELAKATDAVAHGDFSVYVAPLHTPENLDYLDIMIMDFNKMVEELGSVETLKTEFFSNVSHEMKTPMAVISNEAQLLLAEGGLSAKQQESVREILAYTRKMSDLITNILKMNRLEKQKIQPDRVTYDVCEQCCNCVVQFEEKWEEKQIELEVDMEDRVYIEADPTLMELVWNNLLSNAVKFTDPGGKITIKEMSDERDVAISIMDTGCGMDETTMNHIFDKFYQGDTSHATEGNGLGMALVLRILQLSDGDITVKSTEGVGSTFVVTLPKLSNNTLHDFKKSKNIF
ncbi:HAMP domain-containing sensor histidine kinase [Hespellia stercorisuis]|uniref:histidine kinase n=1 Tax=Hespellia stercorisuis DSM 15480 TaxID=1121950 RepID=A0A1M6SXM0_9FIRM|nr:HAMP domain-containing sensor histidine kinase [Hespellia stercorisuis]SHK49436.1 Signal transduction histidine kinase [Hespellia stercorisuis DSM 15480]